MEVDGGFTSASGPRTEGDDSQQQQQTSTCNCSRQLFDVLLPGNPDVLELWNGRASHRRREQGGRASSDFHIEVPVTSGQSASSKATGAENGEMAASKMTMNSSAVGTVIAVGTYELVERGDCAPGLEGQILCKSTRQTRRGGLGLYRLRKSSAVHCGRGPVNKERSHEKGEGNQASNMKSGEVEVQATSSLEFSTAGSGDPSLAIASGRGELASAHGLSLVEEKVISLNCGILDLRFLSWRDSQDSDTRRCMDPSTSFSMQRLVALGSDVGLHIFSIHLAKEMTAVSSDFFSMSLSGGVGAPQTPLPSIHIEHSHTLDLRSLSKLSLDESAGTCIGVSMDCLSGAAVAPLQCVTAVCASDGMAYVVEDLERVTSSWRAHRIETWSIAFDPFSGGRLVATGADDCELRLWDLRAGVEKGFVVCNSKTHTMGVTCVAFPPHQENLLYTGSFDNYLRIWDSRNVSTPLQSTRCSGPPWRIKWSRDECEGGVKRPKLLVATYDGGCEVWEPTSSQTTQYERSHIYAGMQSLCYGFGVVPDAVSEGFGGEVSRLRSLGISSSFYDKKLHLWDFCGQSGA